MTAHISGHLDVTEDEFMEHYYPKIMQAAKAGHKFVVSDCRGVDQHAIQLLRGLIAFGVIEPVVTVYHLFESSRVDLGPDIPSIGNYPNHTQCDAAMTAASDYDIAWIRPGKEKSGTARNLQRRAKLAK